ILYLLKKSILILLILWSHYNFANPHVNDKMKAVFIYNFLKYIHWPSEVDNSNFVIGIKDAPGLYEELMLITKIKSAIGNHAIIVKKIDQFDESVNVLFVGNASSSNLGLLAEKSKQNHVLLISDIEGSIANGVCIELIIDTKKAEFDISKKHLKENKLSVAQQLLDMARNVE
ncbi:MAG: hypothetical protein RL711_679, partial [Bacteroidota bacterium]